MFAYDLVQHIALGSRAEQRGACNITSPELIDPDKRALKNSTMLMYSMYTITMYTMLMYSTGFKTLI